MDEDDGVRMTLSEALAAQKVQDDRPIIAGVSSDLLILQSDLASRRLTPARIVQAHDQYGPHPKAKGFAERVVWHYGEGVEPPPDNYIADPNKIKVVARINHGKWVGDCPWCNGSVVVSQYDPRFFCIYDLNAPVGGRWVVVEFPNADVMASVEAELLLRPRYENRNWHPHETVEQLRLERRMAEMTPDDLPPGKPFENPDPAIDGEELAHGVD